jgi:hypothetical protein
MAKPIKLLKVTFGGVSVKAYATVNGIQSIPSQWNAVLKVATQPHSDPTSTPAAYFFDGRSVKVGDWIVSSSEGKSLRVASISSATSNSVSCVLEDVNNFNALNDETGNLDGMIPTGTGVVGFVYETVANMPLISSLPAALPGNLSPTFAQNVIARFQAQFGQSNEVKGPLSVAGVVHSTSGGFRFPDGTVQSSASLGYDLSPYAKLDGSIPFTGNVRIDSPTSQFLAPGSSASAPAFSFDSDTTTGIGRAGVAGGISFFNAGTRSAGINAAGNWSLGPNALSSNASDRLNVDGDIRFMSGSDGLKFYDGTKQTTAAVSYTHPTGDGSLHVPATGSTNNSKVLKAGSTPGVLAWGSVAFSELTSRPTTLSGYGITDAAANTHNHSLDALSNVSVVSKAVNDILQWNGSNWINKNLDASGVLLGNSPIEAGTGAKVSYDSKGLVTGSTGLAATDIPALNWSKITAGKPTTLSGYGITDAVGSSHVGSGAAAHSVATSTTAGFMSAGDKSKLDGISMPTFQFMVKFTGSNPSGVYDLPTGWTATISGSQVTVNHTVGIPLKNLFFWGVSTAGGVQRMRLPSASNEVTIPLTLLNSQFTAAITTAVSGSDTDGSVRVVVIF